MKVVHNGRHLAVQGIQPNCEVVLHMPNGVKLVIESPPAAADGVQVTICGNEYTPVTVYDKHGEELFNWQGASGDSDSD